jgi:hypothetical protein
MDTTRRTTTLCLLLAALLLPFDVRAAEPGPEKASTRDYRISVYVAAPTRGGFIEGKDVADSVTDVQNELRKQRSKVVLVASEADADIVIRVLDRGTNRGHFVQAEMRVGEYTKDLTVSGVSGLGDKWGECAEQIVKKLIGWVEKNRDALVRQRAATRPIPGTAEIKAAGVTYSDCVFASAEPRIGSPASPSDIADAGLDECVDAYEALRSALHAPYYVKGVEAHRRADAFLIEVRDDTRRAVVGAVLSAREAK